MNIKERVMLVTVWARKGKNCGQKRNKSFTESTLVFNLMRYS